MIFMCILFLSKELDVRLFHLQSMFIVVTCICYYYLNGYSISVCVSSAVSVYILRFNTLLFRSVL
jgi:hypothetical protein